LVKSNKTLVAIEERRKWEKREKELLEKLKTIRQKKESYLKRIKKLKSQIKKYEQSIYVSSKDSRDISKEIQRPDDIVR